jgi:Ca2+-binding RTX toxin-like protein
MFGDTTAYYAYGFGNDVMHGGSGEDFMVGDTVGAYGEGTGNDAMYGDSGNDILFGDGGDDTISGGGGNDSLDGQDGDDVLRGDAGDDALSGGTGTDELRGGGDADEFIFDDGQSGVGDGVRDVIAGAFQGAGAAGGDLIVLEDIDADINVAGDQDFQFDANNSFDSAGDLIRTSNGAGGTVLQLHTDGDGVVDMEIEVAGVAPNVLTAADIDL